MIEDLNLNNREIAAMIWLAILVFFLLIHKDLRRLSCKLIKSLITLWKIWLLMGVYIAILILILAKVSFWEDYLIKETIIWIFGTAIVLLINHDKARKSGNYFKSVLKDSFKFLVFYEFVINLSTFSLLGEIILLPILVFLGAMSAYSETDKKYVPVKKLMDLIIGFFGMIILYKTVRFLIDFYPSYINGVNIKEFLLPSILTTIYLPFLYFSTLFFLYENIFVRYKIWFKENKILLNFAKFQTLKNCHVNWWKLSRFEKDSVNKIVRCDDKSCIKAIIKKNNNEN